MMHFYPHYIADFNNATRHLERLERSIYRECIEMYYDTESPLDGTDMERLRRRLLCLEDADRNALDFVLSEFFEEEDGFYTNSRCDKEIAAYKGRNKEASSKQDNAKERKRRYRDSRSKMFAALATIDVVPKMTTQMSELRELYAEHFGSYSENEKETSLEQGQDRDGTANQNHNQNHNYNIKSDYSDKKNDKTQSLPFDDFWNSYDYKKGGLAKPKAKWLSLSIEKQKLIMAHVPHYVNSTPNKSFRKYPMTYLNNESWLDEITESGASGNEVEQSSSARPHSNRSDSFESLPQVKSLSREEQIAANKASMEKAGLKV